RDWSSDVCSSDLPRCNFVGFIGNGLRWAGCQRQNRTRNPQITPIARMLNALVLTIFCRSTSTLATTHAKGCGIQSGMLTRTTLTMSLQDRNQHRPSRYSHAHAPCLVLAWI